MNRVYLLNSENKPGEIETEIDFDHELSDAYNYFEDTPLTEYNFNESDTIKEHESKTFLISAKIQETKNSEKSEMLKNYEEDEEGISDFLKNGLRILSKRNKEFVIAFNYPRTFLNIKEKLNLNTLDPIIERIIHIKSIQNDSKFNGVTPKVVSVITKNPISPEKTTKSSFYLFPFESNEKFISDQKQKSSDKNIFVIENLVTGNGNLVTTPNEFKFNADVCALFLTEYFSRNIMEPSSVGNQILQKFYEDYHGVYNTFFHTQLDDVFHITVPSDKEQIDLPRFPVFLNNQQLEKIFDQ